MTTPTTHQFTKYQRLYDYYNKQLFGNKLPPCLLILSRATARICGHFSKDRWQDKEGNKTHEINLNPVYMAMATDMDICQTLVHEMVHLWQFEFGKPSRAGYHNKEWAAKMQEVGLMPSNTGKEGGKTTGQNMSDYPIEGGVFEKAFHKMPEKVILPFRSAETIAGVAFVGGSEQEGEGDDAEQPKPTKPKKNKTKYSCSCGNNIWGKPELNVICGDCEEAFQAVN